MNVNGSGLKQLTPWARGVADKIDWSPDGSRILLTMPEFDRPGVSANVFSVRRDGPDLKQLTHDAGGLKNGADSWSPDGQKVIFISNRDGAFKTYSMNADGSGQSQSRMPMSDLDQLEQQPRRLRERRAAAVGARCALTVAARCGYGMSVERAPPLRPPVVSQSSPRSSARKLWCHDSDASMRADREQVFPSPVARTSAPPRRRRPESGRPPDRQRSLRRPVPAKVPRLRSE